MLHFNISMGIPDSDIANILRTKISSLKISCSPVKSDRRCGIVILQYTNLRALKHSQNSETVIGGSERDVNVVRSPAAAVIITFEFGFKWVAEGSVPVEN